MFGAIAAFALDATCEAVPFVSRAFGNVAGLVTVLFIASFLNFQVAAVRSAMKKFSADKLRLKKLLELHTFTIFCYLEWLMLVFMLLQPAIMLAALRADHSIPNVFGDVLMAAVPVGLAALAALHLTGRWAAT